MTLDFKKKGKVKVSMIEYLQEVVSDFPEQIDRCVATPAADHLFTVNPEGVSLEEPLARQFHTSVAINAPDMTYKQLSLSSPQG